MISHINDLRRKARLGSAVAATAITGVMLVSVGLGFPKLASAAETAAPPTVVKVPATVEAGKAKALIDRASRAFLARVAGEHITELWLFPTGDANALFVYYTTSGDAGVTSVKSGAGARQHLALIEMDGEQIARLQDFSAPAQVMAAETQASTEESIL